MANRHSHKQRRRAIRARMALTGESYQSALRHLPASHDVRRPSVSTPELLRATYFGLPVTLAVYTVFSRARLIVVSGCSGPLGLPLGNPSPLHVDLGALQ